MKRGFWKFAFLLAGVANLLPLAQAATGPGTVEQQIASLEETWNNSYGANDLSKYFSYYGDDPLLVFYNERTTLADYRQMWTQAIKTEPLQSARMSDLRIRVNPSGDTAIASYKLDVRTRHAGRKTTLEQAFETDVWFKQQGEWRVQAVHYSAIAAK